MIGPVPIGLFGEEGLHFEKRINVPIEQTMRVSRVILHPDYYKPYNDIGLIQLERPVSGYKVDR